MTFNVLLLKSAIKLFRRSVSLDKRKIGTACSSFIAFVWNIWIWIPSNMINWLYFSIKLKIIMNLMLMNILFLRKMEFPMTIISGHSKLGSIIWYFITYFTCLNRDKKDFNNYMFNWIEPTKGQSKSNGSRFQWKIRRKYKINIRRRYLNLWSMPCEFSKWILSLWRDQQTFKNGESFQLSNSIDKNYVQSKVMRMHRSTVIVCDVKPSSDNSPEHLSKLYDWYCQNTNRYHSWNDTFGSVQTERRFFTKRCFP